MNGNNDRSKNGEQLFCYLLRGTAFLNVWNEYTLTDFRVFSLDDHYSKSVLALRIEKVYIDQNYILFSFLKKFYFFSSFEYSRSIKFLPFLLVYYELLCTGWTCQTVKRKIIIEMADNISYSVSWRNFWNFNIDICRVIIYSWDILGRIDFGSQNKHKSSWWDRNIGWGLLNYEFKFELGKEKWK